MINKRWAIWLPLLGIAAWLALSEPPADVAEAAARPTQSRTPPSSATSRKDKAVPPPIVEAVIPREQLVPAEHRQGPRRDLFAARSWAPEQVEQLAPTPAAEPSQPALTYPGKLFDGEQWQVYIAMNDTTLILTRGASIEGRYRVEDIAPPTLSLRNLQSMQLETLAIGDAP
jgi:hypothetical protein